MPTPTEITLGEFDPTASAWLADDHVVILHSSTTDGEPHYVDIYTPGEDRVCDGCGRVLVVEIDIRVRVREAVTP